MKEGTKIDKNDIFSIISYNNFKKDYEEQMRLHSIWAEPKKNAYGYEVIRGSSFCAVKCNTPNRFKKEEHK